jgi:DNA topoisomerase VI subunit B
MTELIARGNFLEAFRDAGYRGLPGALAELVDNSLEAGCGRVDVSWVASETGVMTMTVLDDGCGIPPSAIPSTLQFGGTTRFNGRSGFGRYGIGLPGSSLSQARRVDVYSWRRVGSVWSSYLALDSVLDGSAEG